MGKRREANGESEAMTFTFPTSEIPLLDWASERNKAMAQVATNSGPCFQSAALKFVVRYLREHGPTSGEVVTDAAKRAGIVPHDDRAFGPCYAALVRDGIIERHSYTRRLKGHGTGGASVWRIKAFQ